MSALADAIQAEAATASRAGQYENLTSIAYAVDLMEAKLARIEALCDERGADLVEADPIWPDELRAMVRGDE